MDSQNFGKSIIITLLIVCAVYVQSASINDTDGSEDRAFKSPSHIESGRTFGAIKKFQSALLPIMYKLGVMSAVIFMTLFLAFKSVFITTLILILNLTFFAIKFGSFLKHDHGHHYIAHSSWPSTIQHGHGHHGWAPPSSPHKDVHLHIHNAHGKPDFSIPYSTLSGGWETQAHASAVEPSWSTGTSYVHSGRGFSDGDLTPYASTQQQQQQINDDQHNLIQPKLVEKRIEREPTIVMAQTNQANTPYDNYLNTQRRK